VLGISAGMQTLAGDAMAADAPAWVQLSGECSPSDGEEGEPMKIPMPAHADFLQPPLLGGELGGEWTPGRILLTEASPSGSPRTAPPAWPPSLQLSLSSVLPPVPPPMATDEAEVLAAFPPGLEGAPSPGSALHHLGACRPCGWFWKPGGCTREGDCAYCHLCPAGAGKARARARRQEAAMRSRQAKDFRGAEAEAAWAAMSLFSTLEAAGKLQAQADATCRSSDAETVARTSSEQSDEAELFAGSSAGSEERQEEVAVTANPGSALHSLGRCSPCAWFWKPVGCRRGPTCDHCHLCPEDERKNRKKKKASMLSHGSASPDCSPISFRSAGCSPKFSAGSATPGCSPTSGFQPAGFALNLSALL